MALLNQSDIAAAMIAQLRAFDPAVSGEVGTPERMMLDTVADQISSSTLDFTVIDGSLDITTQFGDNLDRFVSLFNFNRQAATAATGYVTFSRPDAAPATIPIGAGTRVAATAVASTTGGGATSTDVLFSTTLDASIAVGQTSITIPVTAVLPGSNGDVAANTITSFVAAINGVTAVTNALPTSQGNDEETDAALKVRFQNTVFRNVSGTESAYLAAAVSTFSNKANVVGPISRYREYIQVPRVDDSATDPISSVVGNGNPGEWTTAMSTIPYSKHIYSTIPSFVSNGDSGTGSVFYRSGTDFRLNTDPNLRYRGDTYREFISGKDADPHSGAATYRPNITFLAVVPTAADASIQGVRPSQVALMEHSYMSSASRNDYDRKIFNAVDIFVNGSQPVSSSTTVPLPTVAGVFVDDPNSAYYFQNYRRAGEPQHRPILGNALTTLFNEPVLDVPASITVGTTNYYKGTHYWAVTDVSSLGGTARARGGIEWSKYTNGQAPGDPANGPFTGPAIMLNTSTLVPINGYTYDKNIVDAQLAIEGVRQVTTDVLVHRATARYFKLDVTVMYAPGSSVSTTNAAMASGLKSFYDAADYGAVIQLSDLIQILHNTSGVDNVRWSVEANSNLTYKVAETDINGNNLLNVIVDNQLQAATTTPTKRQDQLYLVGNWSPTGGSVSLSWGDAASATSFWVPSTQTVAYSVFTGNNAASLQSTLRILTGDSGLVVSGAGSVTSPFLVTYSGNTVTGNTTSGSNIITTIASTSGLSVGQYISGPGLPLTTILSIDSASQIHTTGNVSATATGAVFTVGYSAALPLHPAVLSVSANNLTVAGYTGDFFLADSELPALPAAVNSQDAAIPGTYTVPGLIIRPRAQNTWNSF